MQNIRVAPDGFLWWGNAKLQVRFVPGRGLEFFEKDPRRAALCGGPLFVVPFEAIIALCDYDNNSIETKKGEQDE